MNIKIKFFSRLLAVALLVLLASCNNDLYQDAIQQNNNKRNITEKSFDELMLDEKFKNAYSKINKTKPGNSFSKTVMEANYNFTISNLPAKVIDVNNKISYTFHITRDFSDADSFENLIVSIDSLKQVKAYIAKYQIGKSHNSSTNKIPFKSVKYHSIVYNNNSTAKVTDCVSFVINLCTDTGEDYCGGSICGFAEITVCGGSSGEIDNGGGTVWGGIDTSGNVGTVTTPVGGGGSTLITTNAQIFFNSFSRDGFERPLLTALYPEASTLLSNYINNNTYPSTNSIAAKTFITSLTQNSEWFTDQSVATQTSIFNYLISNNFSLSSTDFVNQMIDTSILLDVNAVSIWNDYDNFRNQMANSEKVFFDNLLPNRKLWYMCAAKKAFDKANELFPSNININNNIHNGKGDAYRHALWNGISTLLIGNDLTEQLTTAHESKPSEYPFNYKENEMDLYNNNKGRQIAIYSNINNISANILIELQSGYLRYLSNRDSNSLATIYSTLIPTDQ